MTGRLRLLLLIGTTIAAPLLVSCSVAMAGIFPLVICGSSPRDFADGLSWSANAPLVATAQCPYNGPGLELYSPANKTVGKNATAAFKVTAPAGIAIYSIHVVNAYSQGIGANGWWGEFYWNGGPGPAGSTGPIADGPYNAGGCCTQTGLNSRSIGWFIACYQSSCFSGAAGRVRGMGELDLIGEEYQAPSIIASGGNNLWYQNGWVRGRWPVSFTASDPSGVCGAAVGFGSLPAILTPTPDTAPNRHTWQQCPQQSVPAAVDTSASDGSLGRGEGAMQLRLTATNTANVTANPTKTVYVDNSTPTVALSGPTDAPSTAGTQYVTATGSAGPSGVSGIACSVDGAPYQWYPGTSTRVPLAALGVHKLTCYSANNARDSSGNVATSTPQSWTLSIREPTVSAIAFSKLVDALRCHQARERLVVRARWVTVRRHHKRIRVHRGAHTKVIKVTRCHARIALRRVSVWKTVMQRGRRVRVRRTKLVRVVLPPHFVNHTTRHIAHGHGTTVSGWLGTVGGTALGGQPMLVLTAPDNGQGAFRVAASVTTAANGSWTAKLGAGPSRLVEAVYPGGPLAEPTSSGQVQVIVPAKVKLIRVFPRRVAWGGTVRIVGQLVGGYLPAGGALVRLRIGSGSSYTTYGVQEHVTGNGRFSTTYTFGAGQASSYQSFWFQLSSLPMGSYPYSPSDSGRRSVLVGGHPASPHRRHRKR
jgi:hypothetical protein